jgi:hypothetical protein
MSRPMPSALSLRTPRLLVSRAPVSSNTSIRAWLIAELPDPAMCVMAWPGREFAKTHGTQFAAQRLFRDRDPELFEDPLRQIDQPPADDTMDAIAAITKA